MISLRLARLSDIPLLEHWDRQEHVIASGGDDDVWDWPEEIDRGADWQEMLVAEWDGRPIGFVQIIDPYLEESHYWGDCEPNLRAIDIWIGDAEDLGKGYGAAMMTAALRRCIAAKKVTAVLIDPLASNTRAIRFYQRLGFEFLENRRFGNDDCCIHRISRAEIELRFSD